MNAPNRPSRDARRRLEAELRDLPTAPPPADLLERIRRDIPDHLNAPTDAGAPIRPSRPARRSTAWLRLAATLAIGVVGVTVAWQVSQPEAASLGNEKAALNGQEAAGTAARRQVEEVAIFASPSTPAPAPAQPTSAVEAPAGPLAQRRVAESPAVAADGPETLATLGYLKDSTVGRDEVRDAVLPAPPPPVAAAPGGGLARDGASVALTAPSMEASRSEVHQMAERRVEEPKRRASADAVAPAAPTESAGRLRHEVGAGVIAERERDDFRADESAPDREPGPAGMFFREAGTHPFVATRADALSTFALDVDTGSYTLVRSYLERGQLPPPAAVRVEEIVNAMRYDDPAPRRGEFTLTAEGAPSPFARAHSRLHLLRLAVKAREVDAAARKSANLTFVVDVSGSMNRENRLGLVKRALGLLLDELDRGDRVALVVYGSRGRVLLPHTGDHAAIRAAIARLEPEGSTNAEEGLRLAYDLAAEAWREGSINRIILCSDGVANVGATGPESILERIGREARRGIELTAVGFGMGNYNDALMEQLANKGDGSYHYVDQLDEARRVFVENLTGTLQTVAKDAKVQVEFDRGAVEAWRLLGYENRDVADRDFRNDRIDAGEVGAGQSATAVYEVRLAEDARAGDRLATLRLRWQSVDGGRVVEASQELSVADVGRSFDRATRDLRLAALAARFAEQLKGTRESRSTTWDDLAAEARRLRSDFRGDASIDELSRLIDRAARLDGYRPAAAEEEDGPLRD